jgi:gamma-glutamylputrescine oxidase
MNTSFWEKYLIGRDYDLLIIGSGIVGMTAAIHAKTAQPKLRIAILERGFQPWGASTRNAGFACFGSVSEIMDDLNQMDEKEVLDLVLERWKGLKLLQEIVDGYDIGFENNGGFEIFTPQLDDLFENCRSTMPKINTLLHHSFGEDVFSFRNELITAFGFKGITQLIANPFEAQLHTGKLIAALSTIVSKMDIQQLFGANVSSWTETPAGVEINLNEHFELHAKKLIVATNGFAKELLPQLDVNPTRAQVLITNEIPNLSVKGCFHMDRGYYYFRNIENRILFGGARNLDIQNEYTSQIGTSSRIQNELEHRLEQHILPDCDFEIEMRWSGTMGTGATKTPIVQHVSNHVIAAVRLGGMGIAIGSLVGQKAAQLISA